MAALTAKVLDDALEELIGETAKTGEFLGQSPGEWIMDLIAKAGGTVPPLQQRLVEILRRHIRDDDAGLSDALFVQRVYERFNIDRNAPLIDPNE